MNTRTNLRIVICAFLIAALLCVGCKQQPASSNQPTQPNEAKPIVGDTKNTNTEPLTLPMPEEPIKTIAGSKLSDEKEVVGGSEAPKITKLKGNAVCYSYRKYAVIVTPSEDVGEEIKVIAKQNATDESF